MRIEFFVFSGNLTIQDLDFERLLKEYDLLPWMKQKLIPGNHRHGEDDLILEVVVFIGTCSKDTYAAQYICKLNTLECLIDLLKAKQEDDEIVLQVRSLNFLRLIQASKRTRSSISISGGIFQ